MEDALRTGSTEGRADAVAALAARSNEPSAAELDALRDCLGDSHKLVQRRAAEAFAELVRRGVNIGDRLAGALDVDDLRLRWGAVYALSRIGPLTLKALPTLLDVIGLDDGDMRWAASELIKGLADSARPTVVDRLLEAAATPGPRRKMALYCLRDLQVPQAADLVGAALADTHLETRLAALALLAKVHADPAAAAAIIRPLIDDADPRMQRAAAATLGNLGVSSPEILAALNRVADSKDQALRRAAERSLRRLR